MLLFFRLFQRMTRDIHEGLATNALGQTAVNEEEDISLENHLF